MNRRNAVLGLMAIPAAMKALAAAVAEKVMGPTVFHWEEMKVEKTNVGEVRHLCKSPTATLDELEMHISTLNPGLESHPPHRHVNEELIILREGECETLSNGKWVKVRPVRWCLTRQTACMDSETWVRRRQRITWLTGVRTKTWLRRSRSYDQRTPAARSLRAALCSSLPHPPMPGCPSHHSKGRINHLNRR